MVGGKGGVLRCVDEKSFDVGDESSDVVGLRVPRAHQPATTLADEGVKFPASLPKRDDDVRRQFDKY